MFNIQSKIKKHQKIKKTQTSNELKDSTGPDAKMPTNSNHRTDFKITMINICNDLVEKVDNTHKKMGNLADKWKVFKSNEDAKNSHSSCFEFKSFNIYSCITKYNFGILDTIQMDLDALSRTLNVTF